MVLGTFFRVTNNPSLTVPFPAVPFATINRKVFKVGGFHDKWLICLKRKASITMDLKDSE
jgi:hypothetical protein